MFKLLCLLFISLHVANCGYPFSIQDHIINLGDPTWNIAIQEFPKGLFVYFYEPYCLPCRQFWPELQKAAIDLAGMSSAIQFAKIECHDEAGVCQGQNVRTLPTLLLYRSGRYPYLYRGPRTAEALKSFVRKAVDSVYESVSDEATLFRYNSLAIVTKTSIQQVNEAYKDLLDDVEIVKAEGNLLDKLENVQAAAIYSQRGDLMEITLGDTVDSIKTKVNTILVAQKTVARNFGMSDFVGIQDKEPRNFVFFFRTNKFDPKGDAAKAFDEVTHQHKSDNYVFLYVNSVTDLFGNFTAALFGVTKDSKPTVGVMLKTADGLKKFKLGDDKEITVENVNNLIESSSKNDQKNRYYMSASVPGGKNYDNILEVVGTNFNSVTSDSSKNVLIMFYVPLCEWCTRVLPALKALAYRFRNNPDIVIAKIDMSQNDVEGYYLTEYPLLRFFPAGQEQTPVDYTGDKNIEGLKAFLKTHIPNLDPVIDL